LINAKSVNSDMAVVGLQAMHILRGEWDWHLWGAGYQSSVDALLTALVFAVFGHGPFVLACVPVVGHVLLVGFAFAVLHGHFRPWPAVLLSLPVVLTPMAVNYNLIMVQRESCWAMFIVSVWLLSSAASARHPLRRYALGAFSVCLSLYLDLYAVQWLPAAVLFAFLCVFDGPRNSSLRFGRALSTAAGFALGIGSFLWLRGQSPGSDGQVGMAINRIPTNFRLLWDTCLPYTLGAKTFFNNGNSGTEQWVAPSWFRPVQLLGVLTVGSGLVFAGLSGGWRRIPWKVRRLGVLGVVVTASSIGAFLVSVMPADSWSSRYLAPIILVLPFTFAPAAYWLPVRTLPVALAPYLVAAAVSGWMSFGRDYTKNDWPVLTVRGSGREEAQLASFLRTKGVKVGAAQYWLAYRLTYLFEENPIIVPLHAGNDRYGPYRAQFDAAKTVAYVFHPTMPWTGPEDQQRALEAHGARFEKNVVAGYTVLIEQR
jgi:hypothetical protein